MQKKIVFPLFLFPLVSLILVLLLHKTLQNSSSSKVLAAHSSAITPADAEIAATYTPTLAPSPTYTPTPSIKKAVRRFTALTRGTTNPSDYILGKINEYRISRGLSPVTANTETCSFAKTRAEEISHSFTHDGFTDRISNNNLPYPSYHDITENIAYNTNYGDVVNTWIASPGHEENIRKNTPFICVGKYGNYYVMEGWRP